MLICSVKSLPFAAGDGKNRLHNQGKASKEASYCKSPGIYGKMYR